MGEAHVTVRITNPAAPERFSEGLFLVDSGAIGSLVARPHREAIGLEPKGQRTCEPADGSELVLDVAVAENEFRGGSLAEPSSWGRTMRNGFLA